MSGACEPAPFAREQTDRAKTLDGNTLAFFNLRTNGAMVGRWSDVAEIECFLVRDRVRDLEKVEVGKRHPDIFGLSSSETTREM
jgi:hypothetical protein